MVEMEPLELDLPTPMRRCLQHLVGMGIYGATEDEVATYLLRRELHDLTATKVLPLVVWSGDANGR